MSESTALSQRTNHAVQKANFADYAGMLDLAAQLVTTGFLPAAIKTPAQALAIILTGQELGLGPMQSLRSIYIVQQKPALSADLQLALFKKNGGRARFETLTDERAVLWLKHPNGDEHTETFTMKDAALAGVTGNPTWKKFPKAMLRSRAITAGLKSVGFEPTTGLFDPEELGKEVVVESLNDEGEEGLDEGRNLRALPDVARGADGIQTVSVGAAPRFGSIPEAAVAGAGSTPTSPSPAPPKTTNASGLTPAKLSQKNIDALLRRAGGSEDVLLLACFNATGKRPVSVKSSDWFVMTADQYDAIYQACEHKPNDTPEAIAEQDEIERLEAEFLVALKQPGLPDKLRIGTFMDYEAHRNKDSLTVGMLSQWIESLAKSPKKA